MVFEILIEACASFQRRIVLDSRFRGNDVMPAYAGIQFVGCACAPVFCPQSMVRRAHPTPMKLGGGAWWVT